MIQFISLLWIALAVGAFLALFPNLAIYCVRKFRLELKEHKLQLQLLVAMHEMNRYLRSTSRVDRSLDGLRTLLRRIEAIEGMTLEEAEAAARAEVRPPEAVKRALAETFQTEVIYLATYYVGPFAGLDETEVETCVTVVSDREGESR